MENKEMYTKQEVVEMLKDMQRETGDCVGFFVGQVSQLSDTVMDLCRDY